MPPPTPKGRYIVPGPYAAMHWLNDDILLGIFTCYRLDNQHLWNAQLGWCKVSHVCQRWRHLIHKSAFHLGMHIECTNGTPIVDMLDHLPPLPLLIKYKYYTMTEQDELGIYHALQLCGRVQHISLHLPPLILHKCLALMDKCFPKLEHLSLLFTVADNTTTLPLPESFRAPNLHHLTLPGIYPLRGLQILSLTVSLVKLVLWNIQTTSYFQPRLLATRISSLPKLEELSIGFSIPIPCPGTESVLLGEQGTPVMLPNLKYVRFRGVSTYLEFLIAQIRPSRLERLDIVLFERRAFVLPYLSHLINNTEAFQHTTARVSFGRNEVSIITIHHGSGRSHKLQPLCLGVMCKRFDQQVDCAAQISSALIPTLSGIKKVSLDFHQDAKPILREVDSQVDSTAWHELLRSFVGVEELHITHMLLNELSRVLRVEIGSEPGFLPVLRYIHAERNLFTLFIHARQLAGRPVQYSRW
jgi:hypothetical protein